MKHAAKDDNPKPKSPGDLFISFTLLALQGFGGALAVAQRELVENKRWLTPEEFAEEWAVAQILPGPNVVNLAVIIGGRYFGLRGALAALAGMLAIPLAVLLVLALCYSRYAAHPGVSGALRGMSAVAAGMIAAIGIKFFPALKAHPLGLTTCIVIGVISFVCVALLRVPVAYVLLGLGALACALTYRRIKQ